METLPHPNPAPLILLPLGQRVPALSPFAAGTVTPGWSRAVRCSTAWGEETGRGNACQQMLEGLNVTPMLCVGVGHSGIFYS